MPDIITLDNGLRVVWQRMAHLRSVSVGIWVKAGSMLESEAENGLSHLNEHMSFKALIPGRAGNWPCAWT